MTDCSTSAAVVRKRRARLALIVSALVHVVLIVVLLIYRPWQHRDHGPASPTGGPSSAAANSHSPPRPEDPIRVGTDPESLTSEQVAVRLEHAQRLADKRSEEENMEILEENIGRLDEISTPHSIERLGTKLQDWMGTKRRQDAPDGGATEDDFDFTTSQLTEVTRQQDANGNWVYTGVLTDSQGRTFPTEMDPAEGARSWRTMQLLRRSRLAEKVYRDLTLPLMDKMLDDGLPEVEDPGPPSTWLPAAASDRPDPTEPEVED